jgi:hypothetical protein
VRGKRRSRQGCQRLDRVDHRGKKTPTLASPGREALERESSDRRRSAEAVSDAVKHPVPRSILRSLSLRGRPRSESCESEPGTREVRVHMIRMGGRHRLDASRVFSAGRLQGLLAKREGASQEEVRSTTDVGRGWVEGETVRVHKGS